MSGARVSDGGCLCGAVRYRVEGEPIIVGACHCTICQHTSGAPFFAGVVFPKARVTVTRGAPKSFASSADARRHFCGECGSQLFFEPLNKPDRFEVTIGSLDDPAAFRPTQHIFCRSRQPWLALDDGLPCFEEWRPKGINERAP
jgi:hypothetical protein